MAQWTSRPGRWARATFFRLADRIGFVRRSMLRTLVGHGVVTVRGRGLWAGVDVEPSLASGRQISKALLARGVLAKDTHGSTIRLAPPIVISEEDLLWAVDQLGEILAELQTEQHHA